MSIVKTDLRFVCRSCGYNLDSTVKSVIKCPKCGSKQLEIIARPTTR